MFAVAQERGFIAAAIQPRDVAEFALAINLGSVIPDLVAGDGRMGESLHRLLPLLIDGVLVPSAVDASAS